MFHRAQPDAIKNPSPSPEEVQQNSQPQAQNNKSSYSGINQTAVKQYAKSQEEVPQQVPSANQNATTPYAVKRIIHNPDQRKFKEARSMNNPQKQDSDNNNTSTPMQPQARVDIPGNNFQRPGVPANRPAYPGAATYPGAQNSPSYSPASSHSQSHNMDDNSRKLVIGQGITMSGEIESCDHLIVQGTIEASLKGANILDVTETGSYFGTVEIQEANIAGRFEGDITVSGRLTIESTGTIIGTVSYKELSMEAGATLDGTVSPIGSQNAGKTVKASVSSRSKKVSSTGGAELPFADRNAAE